MSDRWTVLGISNEFYDMENCSVPAKIFYGLKTEMPVAAPTLYDTQKYFDMACAIAAISEGKIDDLADYFGILDLTDTTAAGVLQKGKFIHEEGGKDMAAKRGDGDSGRVRRG